MVQIQVNELEIEREILSRDLVSFLNYIRIPDPPPFGNGTAVFQPWDHIIRLHKAVETTNILPPES